MWWLPKQAVAVLDLVTRLTKSNLSRAHPRFNFNATGMENQRQDPSDAGVDHREADRGEAFHDGASQLGGAPINSDKTVARRLESDGRQTPATDDVVLSVGEHGHLLCQRCKSLELRCMRLTKLLPSKSKMNIKDIELSKNFRQLDASAYKGCQTCRVWRKYVLLECFTNTDTDMTRFSTSPIHMMVYEVSAGYLIRPRSTKSIVFPNPGIAQLWITNYDKLDKGRPGMNESWRSGPSEAFNKVAVHWVRRRQEECLHQHLGCRETHHEIRSSLPKRLIRVDTAHSSQIQVIDTEHCQPEVDYVALSYRWGGNEEMRTLSINLDLHGKGIPDDALPSLIKDAVIVCRVLAIPYLWVDRLCIVQDSSEWNEESGRMDVVYGNASFTLAICSSDGASQGFLRARYSEALPLQSSVGLAGLGVKKWLMHDLDYVRSCSELASRIWTFQEELLSTRILYWTANAMYWSCVEGWCRESEATARPHYPAKNPHGLLLHPKKHLDWTSVVQEYSSRTFTRPEDRLQALTGLARLYNDSMHDIYLAGHWRSTLPASLLWEANGTYSVHQNRGLLSIAPSWSWVSYPKGVYFPEVVDFVIDLEVRAQLLNCQTTPASGQGDANYFGPVTSGSLLLKARMTALTLESQAGALQFGRWVCKCRSNSGACHVRFDYWPLLGKGLLYAIEIGIAIRTGNRTSTRALVVQPIDGESYRRVGIAYTRNEEAQLIPPDTEFTAITLA